VRGKLALTVIVALLVAGCTHAGPRGTVDGYFRLPGRSADDLQRGGLNFLSANENGHGHRGVLSFLLGHGSGHGHTTRVGAGGWYTVTLSPGSYRVIGGLSGHAGGPPAESCASTINVVVTAKSTTRADYVCHATPVGAP
jgi:hypothetical protein